METTHLNFNNQKNASFVKVLDELTYGLVDEDEPIAEPTDRAFWETRGTKSTLAITDNLLKLVNAVEPKAILKYNKHYIGLDVNGAPLNFVSFWPRKAHVIMAIKLPKTQEVDDQLSEVGFETLTYEAQWRQYRLRIEGTVDETQKGVLVKLMGQAREGFGETA